MRNIRTIFGRGVLTVTLVVAMLAMGLQPAAATAAYGLRNQLCVEATSGSQQQQFCHDTEWTASPSPLTQSFTADVKYTVPEFGLAEGYASATQTVFYGALEASGNGFASPIVTAHEPGFYFGYGALAGVTPYVGGNPLVSYQDQLVVTSHTLSIGTPVALSFAFSFDGTSSFVNEPEGYLTTADIATEFTMDDLNAGATSFDLQISSAGNYVETRTVAVGDVLDIAGALFANGFADSGYPTGNSSFSYSDPTTEIINVGSADAFLVSASGHDYSSPSVVGVPEPGTLGLFGFGAAVIGFCLIKRRTAAIDEGDAA